MTKRLIDVDGEALASARAHLGTGTIKDTVNQELRLASARRIAEVDDSLAVLAEADLFDRSVAWH